MVEDRLRDILAPSGALTAAINVGNPVLAWITADGGLAGPSVEIATDVAELLGVDLHPIVVEHARLSFELLSSGKADLGFLAIDPVRAERLAFSIPYIAIEGGYLAAVDTEFRTVDDVDKPSIKIAASKGSAYNLYLQRAIERAVIISTSSLEESLALLESGSVDVAAGIRDAFPPSKEGIQWRLLEGSFMEIRQAICVPKQNAEAIEFLNNYVANRSIASAS
jgi:polar amino acid transport system substrate-binding protein